MPASCAQPNKSPDGRASNISGVMGREPRGPGALERTSYRVASPESVIFSKAMGIGNSDATTRRTFLTALSAASYTRIAGANGRVQVGFIGYGLIGSEHVRDFKKQSDADLIGLCDVYQTRRQQCTAA